MSLKALSEYTFYSRYAKYLPEKNRRETWEESVERVFGMHEKYFESKLNDSKELKEYFSFAKQAYLKKRALGSQRALQFGGDSILKKSMRMFNCSTTHIDRPRVFQEAMWVLLCGTGLGFSVQKHHVKKLPDIQKVTKDEKLWVCEDSIEGWSDAIGLIVNSYFSEEHSEFVEYSGKKVIFDYSRIRPEGSYISGGFKAPGPRGLQNAVEKIRNLIEKRIQSDGFKNDIFAGKLRPIDCFDIICLASDAVLSGGVRRSALLTLFSADDYEMATAKTGNWFVENPQRGRSNNSAALNKKTATREEFHKLMESTRQFGEPGFIWVNGEEEIFNPCQPADAKLLTKQGVRRLGDLNIGDEIWSEEGWTKIVDKKMTGIKDVYKYKTTFGYFVSTDNHPIISNGEMLDVGEAESIDLLTGGVFSMLEIDLQSVVDGLVLGDGTFNKAGNRICLCIGQNDQDYFESEIKDFIGKTYDSYQYNIKTTLRQDEVCYTYKRRVPSRFIETNQSKVVSFLRGLYTANGSIVGSKSGFRVTLKSASLGLIEDVQLMLNSIGVQSYYTTNKPSKVKFLNGEYLCKQSYDLNITRDADKFRSLIGFVQNYKNEKLDLLLKNKIKSHKPIYSKAIISSEWVGKEEVFDITVDNKTHTYWSYGFNTHNCCEIGMIPKTQNGESGIQVCNLTEINGRYCSTKEKFFEACKASAIIGTLQAAYTKFDYLTKASEEICNYEALLGCSITGLNDNPEILLDPEIQKQGAEIIKQVNKEVAKLIGINQSARTTCIKPAGSTSCLLQTASGIHPHHAKRYLRRVQANKSEFTLSYFKGINPMAVENSVWSTNGTDDVITFVCEVPDGAKTKNQLSAIDLLEQVKTTQQNWVKFGSNQEIGYSSIVSHNVSNTITILNEQEWIDVEEFIWQNREWFAGISLLPASGDLDYAQAPFATVLTPIELVKEYGDASIFASGLIVDGLAVFNQNLWRACDTVLGYGEKLSENLSEVNPEVSNIIFLKKDWIRRVNQFSERYFSGNIKKAIYCLKHVYLWKTWVDLNREYKDVDWTQAAEVQRELIAADSLAAQACSGGSCELR